MMVTCLQHNGPTALRIPRGPGEGVPLMEEGWEHLPSVAEKRFAKAMTC